MLNSVTDSWSTGQGGWIVLFLAGICYLLWLGYWKFLRQKQEKDIAWASYKRLAHKNIISLEDALLFDDEWALLEALLLDRGMVDHSCLKLVRGGECSHYLTACLSRK